MGSASLGAARLGGGVAIEMTKVGTVEKPSPQSAESKRRPRRDADGESLQSSIFELLICFRTSGHTFL